MHGIATVFSSVFCIIELIVFETFFQEQYMLVHDAILESIVCGVNELEGSSLDNVITKLMKVNSEKKQTGFEELFQVLNYTMHASSCDTIPYTIPCTIPAYITPCTIPCVMHTMYHTI